MHEGKITAKSISSTNPLPDTPDVTCNQVSINCKRSKGTFLNSPDSIFGSKLHNLYKTSRLPRICCLVCVTWCCLSGYMNLDANCCASAISTQILLLP